MAHKIQIKRGNKADLPTLDVGEFGLCQDTNELFIGNSGNQKIFPPTAPTISDVEGLQTALDNKVDNSRVLTNVPVNAKFTDTTYSEISTSEIDAGTSSTLRTITGRRVKYLLDKVQGWINALTKSDIGLGDVENYSIATQSEAESGTANNRYMTPLGTKQAINMHNIYEGSHQDIRQQINDFASQVTTQKANITSTDDATSVTDAPLKSAGGLAVAKNVYIGGNLISLGYRKILQLNNQNLGILSPDKRLRVRFYVNGGHAHTLKINFTSSSSSSSMGSADVIEKTILFHLYQNNITNKTEFIHSIYGYTEEESENKVRLVAVGSNNEIDLIIERKSPGSTVFWACDVDILGVRAAPNIIETIVEDIPL